MTISITRIYLYISTDGVTNGESAGIHAADNHRSDYHNTGVRREHRRNCRGIIGGQPMETKYPVCGPREPVYALLRELGFSMSDWSDKHWKSPDGIQVQVYGAGSMARIYLKDRKADDCRLDELVKRLETLRQ